VIAIKVFISPATQRLSIRSASHFGGKVFFGKSALLEFLIQFSFCRCSKCLINPKVKTEKNDDSTVPVKTPKALRKDAEPSTSRSAQLQDERKRRK